MSSKVQTFPPQGPLDQYYLYEGYIASSSAKVIMPSESPPPTSLFPCNDHKPPSFPMWEADKSCPQMEGLFTPPPLSCSSACTQHHCIDHLSYMETLTRSMNADVLLFNVNTSGFDMDFPEENQLNGMQSKLSMYSSYGDDGHDLSQQSMAAAENEKESMLQACSYGNEGNVVGRSFSLPPAGARTGSSCAARSPLILSSDAGIRNPNNVGKQFNLGDQLLYKENSSEASTSCSNGGTGEPKGKDARLKIESLEVSHCMMSDQDQQECIEQEGTTLSSKGYKKSKKRSAYTGNSNTIVKVARLDTSLDVVHVRARRGQATNSHSLAERVRREKISQRMKVLQEIVPGCHKVLGKAMMLDEIINYVKSLQTQVEFLSMKLAATNQARMASMITNEVKFLLHNMGFFEDFNSSFQAIKSEDLVHSLM